MIEKTNDICSKYPLITTIGILLFDCVVLWVWETWFNSFLHPKDVGFVWNLMVIILAEFALVIVGMLLLLIGMVIFFSCKYVVDEFKKEFKTLFNHENEGSER